MNAHQGWDETALHNSTLDPEHHVVASATIVVTEIMVQADLLNSSLLKKCDGLVGPANQGPPDRWYSLVIEEHAHRSG